MKMKRKKRCAGTACVLVLMAAALGGCGLTGPYPGMPGMQSQSNDLRARENRPEWIPHSEPDQSRALPQVAYRIDENRYFEIVPTTKSPCSSAIIYYVDRRQGIRSEIMDSSRLGGVELVIDAANEDYLVAPIDRGNTDCSSGGGLCGGAKLPYSTDGGRTWKRANPKYSGGYDVYMSREKVYNSAAWASLRNAEEGYAAWHEGRLSDFPEPVKAPIDTQFHCTSNGKE